jgi:predicted SnoaL-like aldol condensation-catalyzing enzyme
MLTGGETVPHTVRRVFGLLPGLVAGPYIQHNPLYPDGTAPLVGYLKQAGSLPCQIKRMAIEGDLVFVHVRYLELGGKEHAGVDIFRFNTDGKLVEHRDVLQPVSEQAANENTMF